MARGPSPRPGMFAANANDISTLPDPGKCLPNVRDFIQAHWAEARRIAAGLGHDVTPTEVLATAGNETHYGDLSYAMVRNGNFFGLHGSGPAGTYYTTGTVTDPRTGKKVHTATAKFPPDQGFAMSGDVFLRKQAPAMTPGLGRHPVDFFTVLNHNGYATGNPNYPAIMTNPTGRRGPYTLARACTGQP